MFSFSCHVLKYKLDQNEDLSKLIRRNIIMIILDLSQSMLYLWKLYKENIYEIVLKITEEVHVKSRRVHEWTKSFTEHILKI